MRPILHIKLSDLFRATMADECGSQGFIGVAPDGSQYHVVVPVDRQIARGLKFWIQPDDGTPFGGYKGWRYFCCLTFKREEQDGTGECRSQLEKAKENGRLMQKWGEDIGLEIRLTEDMR